VSFIRDMDARIRWEAAQMPAPAPHPAPEVVAQVVEVVPAGAGAVRTRALAAGWVVRCTFAKGISMDAKGNAGRQVESVRLAARSGVRHFVVTWTRPIGGTWTVGTCWAWGDAPLRRLSIRDGLSAYLITTEEVRAA
jgi:hypothetical protein